MLFQYYHLSNKIEALSSEKSTSNTMFQGEIFPVNSCTVQDLFFVTYKTWNLYHKLCGLYPHTVFHQTLEAVNSTNAVSLKP